MRWLSVLFSFTALAIIGFTLWRALHGRMHYNLPRVAAAACGVAGWAAALRGDVTGLVLGLCWALTGIPLMIVYRRAYMKQLLVRAVTEGEPDAIS